MTITGIINEEWRSVSGFAGYQVSNIGRVRNVETERILKPSIEKDGYYRICLYKDKSRKRYQIHRLVAQEFIENLDNKNLVDHINHNKSDNTILNLRWVSTSENAMNKTKQQNASSKYKGVCFHKRSNKWSAQFRLNGNFKHLGLFTNEKQAAARYNESALEKFGEHAFLNAISSDEEEDVYEYEEEDETDDVQT